MSKRPIPTTAEVVANGNHLVVELHRLREAVDNVHEHALAGARVSLRTIQLLDQLAYRLKQAVCMVDDEYATWQCETGLSRPCQVSTTTVSENDK